jgi:hypothetical protein
MLMALDSFVAGSKVVVEVKVGEEVEVTGETGETTTSGLTAVTKTTGIEVKVITMTTGVGVTITATRDATETDRPIAEKVIYEYIDVCV